MSKKKIDEEVTLEEVDQIDSLLESKELKGKHLGSRSGDEIEKQDIISTGSFILDEFLGGGFRSSMWVRFYAPPESGKTSISLCWGKNWQNFYPEDGMVIYFNAEGRITPDLLERSGISTSKNNFRIIDTNNAEAVWSIIEKLIYNNPKYKKYFFIVDSTDACVREQDAAGTKDIGDAEKIGGTATILSAAGKRLSLLFNRRGHFLFMCSQVRDKISKGPLAVTGAKDASGGNAPKFYSSLTAEIKPAWSKTYIYDSVTDGEDTSKIPIGKLAEIKFHKTFHEKSGQTVMYPVKYGMLGGVWREEEARMVAASWGLLAIKSNGRSTFNDDFYEEIKNAGINIPQSFSSMKAVREAFESSNEIVDFIFKKVKSYLNMYETNKD